MGANADDEDEEEGKVRSPRWNSCACNLSEDEHRPAELQASFRNNGLLPSPPLPSPLYIGRPIFGRKFEMETWPGRDYVTRAGRLSRRGEGKERRKEKKRKRKKEEKKEQNHRSGNVASMLGLSLVASVVDAPPPPPPTTITIPVRHEF